MGNFCNIQDFLHTDNADNLEEGKRGENRVKLRCSFIVIKDGVGVGGEHSVSTLLTTATKKKQLKSKRQKPNKNKNEKI